MDKNNSLIMVVNKKHLFRDDSFQGFKPNQDEKYISRILENFEYIKRGVAEKSTIYKQPIGYCLIVNPASKKIFAYERALKKSRSFEKRLHGKWSFGVGGHIEKTDAKNNNPILASLLRELDEEVSFNVLGEPKLLGYINDDKTDVGSVHFGILYVFETDSTEVFPKGLEIQSGELAPIEKLENICFSSHFNVESWSKISLNPLKLYLSHLI